MIQKGNKIGKIQLNVKIKGYKVENGVSFSSEKITNLRELSTQNMKN